MQVIASDTFFACNGCHVLDRNGNSQFPEVKKPGFFGTDGQFTFEGNSQFFKVPHLRNLYQKLGKFGMPANPPLPSSIAPLGSSVFFPLANTPLPAGAEQQVRGFGFTHDGSIDTLFRFVSDSVFLQRPVSNVLGSDPRTPLDLLINGKDPGNIDGLPLTPQGILQRRQLESFLLVFDSNLAPIVGQQTTLSKNNATVVGPRIDLLIAEAEAHDCDLVARNRFGGYLYVGNGNFKTAGHDAALISDAKLRAKASVHDGEITYTCVPPGSGQRIALDGVFDNDVKDTEVNKLAR